MREKQPQFRKYRMYEINQFWIIIVPYELPQPTPTPHVRIKYDTLSLMPQCLPRVMQNQPHAGRSVGRSLTHSEHRIITDYSIKVEV